MPPAGRINMRKVSLLGGFCFFLSALEYMIPKPLPFIRLGLANLPLLLALDIMPFSSFMLLGALKVLGQALISGALFSYVFLFSLGGTGISALLMYVLRRGLGKERISLIGISTAGALASNAVQLVLAYFFVFGDSVRYTAAPILALGIVTGTLLGAACEYFIRRSRWYAQAANAGLSAEPVSGAAAAGQSGTIPGTLRRSLEPPDQRSALQTGRSLREERLASEKSFERFRKAREAFCLETFSSGELAAAGLCMMPALLLNSDTGARVVQFLFFWVLAWLSGKKNNPFITFFVILGIIFFNLLVPYGEVLASIGPLTITSGALEGGIRRAVTLEGLFMLSRCCVRKDLALPGVFGEITGEAFRVFSVMAEEKQLLNRQNWAARLDELLISMDDETAEGQKTKPGKTGITSSSRLKGRNPGPITTRLQTQRARKRLILASAIILAWLPLLIRAFPHR